MDSAKNRVKGFMEKYGMGFESIDIIKESSLFMEEMERGLEGKPGTLKMLPTYVGAAGGIPADEPVIAIDAGGTNLRVAVVKFAGGKEPVVEDFKSFPMPGTRGRITSEEFFAVIAQYVLPVLHKSNKIGFCFSYPTEILPNRDGRFIQFSKEVQVSGMTGLKIGESLLDALKAMGHTQKKSIVLLNDTVATLLGGMSSFPGRAFDSYIGFILGTGTNTCYDESVGNIGKIKDAGKGSMLINIESGGYGRAPRGVIDAEFDRGTTDPGDQQFEKMISGAYQGGLVLAIIKKAAADGLFTKFFTQAVDGLKELTSRQIDEFLYYPYSGDNALAALISGEAEGDAENDRLTLYYLIDMVFERAARLVAVNLAAVILKTGKGKNPCRPVCIAAEGTTFNKSKLFKTKLDYYVKEYLNDRMGIYCEFVKAENSTLIGTAIAGLLN